MSSFDPLCGTRTVVGRFAMDAQYACEESDIETQLHGDLQTIVYTCCCCDVFNDIVMGAMMVAILICR